MGRRKKGTRPRIDTSPRRKMSEIIWEFAADFVGRGNSPEERQSLLNAACSAWSIACNPPAMRGPNLDYYVREFQRFNPGADEAELANLRNYMGKLIDRKLEKFPTDLRQIVDARIVKSGDKDHLEITSARLQ